MIKEPEHLSALRRHHEQTALNMLSVAVGLPVQVSREDRLEGAVIEAMQWLQNNAPEQAYDCLHRAYNYQR